jgi:hypothetical protein
MAANDPESFVLVDAAGGVESWAVAAGSNGR